VIQNEARFRTKGKAHIDEAAYPMVVDSACLYFKRDEAVLRAPPPPLITRISVGKSGVTENRVLINDSGVSVLIRRSQETLLGCT
jgi:hypothetical protein